jgi:ATP-binding protein involved in chromosome partitioning
MSSEVTTADVEKVLAEFKDPETGRSVTQTQQVRDINLADGKLSLTLALTSHSAAIKQETQERLGDLLRRRFPSLAEITVNLGTHERPPVKIGQIGLTAKSVIAVGSGKGGVGKSTIAATIALGLKRAGSKVGLLDADIYGPSIPTLLGIADAGKPPIANQKIQPVLYQGMPVMSMGFFVPPGEAVVFRGPMLHGAITQFLRDTAWGELDYLIIDMPPGTGDIALTLSQTLPLAGAVVVCTPQQVALIDAVKAIAMFRKVNVPILGIVENMSGFICPDCGKRYDIFGSGGARKAAEEQKTPFLGEVPLNMQIRLNGDEGGTMGNFDDPIVGPALDKIVTGLVRKIAENTTSKPPGMTLPVLG